MKLSRLSVFEDVASQMCFKFIHGAFNEETNKKMWKAIHDVVEHDQAIHMVYEITYRIGYANSYLADVMSEATYKRKKKAIRDNILKIEGSKNGKGKAD